MKKLTIEEMRQIAKNRAGICLSTHYINRNTKLSWQCLHGHKWNATPASVKIGNWCPICAIKSRSKKLRLSKEELQKIADVRKGRCLSKKYINNKTPIKWECKFGHQWEATLDSVKSGGHWCPVCAGNKKMTMIDMQKIAQLQGGKCLSNRYINNRTKLKWQCRYGHEWKAKPSHIKDGHWCPKCAKNIKGTIDEMRKIAEDRGGKCLSKTYINAFKKLRWECANGHIWEAVPLSTTKGSWCPICSSGLGERICRVYFEQIFKRKFPKVKPNWLLNRKGNRMELDGYCRSLKLAFEHQGLQHYSEDSLYVTDKNSLRERKHDDELKLNLCKENGVLLISIPEVPTLTPIAELKNLIKSQIQSQDIPLPENYDEIDIDLKDAYSSFRASKELTRLLKIGLDMGGKCVSENYINNHTKLLWECKKGHRWKATPASIKSGTWCPTCGGSKKSTIEQMHKLARLRNGKCLSEIYYNMKKKLLWQCEDGHKWEATPDNVKQGTWCPICANKKLSIADMREIANQRGGKCLSTKYSNMKTKLLWQCEYNHQWEAFPYNIKKGHWCPICAKEKRKRVCR